MVWSVSDGGRFSSYSQSEEQTTSDWKCDCWHPYAGLGHNGIVIMPFGSVKELQGQCFVVCLDSDSLLPIIPCFRKRYAMVMA